jgi:hypothetical protein
VPPSGDNTEHDDELDPDVTPSRTILPSVGAVVQESPRSVHTHTPAASDH